MGEIVKDKRNGATAESNRNRERQSMREKTGPGEKRGGAGMTFLGHPLELWMICIVLLNGKIAANIP